MTYHGLMTISVHAGQSSVMHHFQTPSCIKYVGCVQPCLLIPRHQSESKDWLECTSVTLYERKENTNLLTQGRMIRLYEPAERFDIENSVYDRAKEDDNFRVQLLRMV